MNRVIKIWAVAAALVVLLCGCGDEEDKTPVVSFGGAELRVGETTMRELSRAGFSVREFSGTIAETALPGQSFSRLIYYLEQDEQTYAGVALMNRENSRKHLDDCVVYQVLYTPGEDSPELRINQVSFASMTRTGILEQLGDWEYVEEGDSLTFFDRPYFYRFQWEEDTLLSIRVGIDLAGDYITDKQA